MKNYLEFEKEIKALEDEIDELKNIFAFLLKFFNSIRSLLSEINQSLKSRSIKENVKKSSKPKISSEPQTPKEKIINDVSAVSKQPDLPIKDETQLKEVPKLNTEKEDEKKEKTVMPSTELLDRALDDGSSLSETELNQIASLLETKLEEFGIEATVESVLPGPVVTRFEIQPAPGTKASKITNIAQDIARSLSVSSVRVVEVIEGKSFVGIEIPNNNRKMVRLTEILSSKAFKSSPSNLSVALGGVFRILNGKIKSHVQPDYADIKHEYYDPKQMKCVKDFLQFYEPIGPHFQCYSVLWTNDPSGGKLDLRESGEHTHFHSYKGIQDAGHYHFDVTPDEIEYECYFNIAEEVHRVNNIYKELR